MTMIKVREGETLEEALRRFKRLVLREGILRELKQRRHHLSSSDLKKLKRDKARRRARRKRPH